MKALKIQINDKKGNVLKSPSSVRMWISKGNEDGESLKI